jgi:hypothetical protein
MGNDLTTGNGTMNSRTRKALAVSAACLFLATAGCTDTTVEPQSTITEANIFSDPASYQKFVAKLYAGLAVTGQQGPHGNADITATDEGFYNYVRLLWVLNELPTDEAALAWGDPGIQPLNQSLADPQNPWIIAMYYRIYFQVALANEFLRQTTGAKLDSRGHTDPTLRAQVAEYRAEARFLRALSYWHGIDLYGPIPLLDESSPVGATPPPQATRTAVYDFVVAELTDIINDLPAPGAATYGRATGPAAQMLLAKVYLNAGVYTGTTHYPEALAAASAVIAGPYNLAPFWRNNFLADNHTSPEIIFPVTSDGLRTQTWGGTTFLIHASCGGGLDNAAWRDANGIDFCWWGLRMKPEAYNRYAAGDTARTSFFWTTGQTVAMASLTDWFNGVPAPKYSNVTSTGAAGSHSTHPDTDYPMFRLADAYLMYAEAQLRGGGGSRAEALTYVNDLRTRAYGNTNGNITDPELTLDFILDERGRELLWEGHRRTDLIRFSLFAGGTYLWAWKGGVVGGVALSAFRNLYPFPGSELVANPNLKQNPGY